MSFIFTSPQLVPTQWLWGMSGFPRLRFFSVDTIQDVFTWMFFVVALFVFWTAGRRALISWKARSALRGKVVLITGGANGIGIQVARRVHALGATVIVWDIDGEGLHRVG